MASEIQRVPNGHVVLPLATPVVGVSGKVYGELPVPAGTQMTISILGYNLYVGLLDLHPCRTRGG